MDGGDDDDEDGGENYNDDDGGDNYDNDGNYTNKWKSNIIKPTKIIMNCGIFRMNKFHYL